MSKLVFPGMTVIWFLLLVLSGMYPAAFVDGARIVFLLAVVVSAILSYVGMVKYAKHLER